MPKLLTTPFATSGSKNDVPTTTGTSPNSATYNNGFPDITMKSFADGGLAPSGKDFNGIFYDITDNIVYQTQGGRYKFDSTYATAIGGYPLSAILLLNDGVTDVISTIANNLTDPNVSMTGWVYKSQTLATNDYTTLAALSAKDGVIAFVKANGISGEFVYNSASTATPNGGTIIESVNGGNWVRLFTGKAQAAWFGAISGTDSTVALQKAIDSQLAFECEYQAVYKISSTLILKHGTDNTGKKYSNNIDFNYCELQPQMADYTLKIQSIGNYAADRATCVSQFGLKNVLFNLGTKVGSKAYRIGSSDNFVDSFYQSYIENFLVIAPDFTWGTVTTIENARHFRNVGVVHRMCGIDIRCDTNDMFTGDIGFKTCEFSGNASSRPFIIQAGMTGSNGQCRGITMRDCDVYGSSSKIYVDGNGQVGDIWIQDTQFDAPPYAQSGEIGLEVYAKGSGQLFQHHVNGNYFVGFNGAGLRIAKDEGGTGKMLDYRGNHYNNITGHVNSGLCAAYVLRMPNIDLSASFFDGLTNCQGAVNIDNAKSTKMLSADITNCTTVPYAVLVGGESKFFNLSNITTDTSNPVIVNDYSTATASQKVINNNMQVV